MNNLDSFGKRLESIRKTKFNSKKEAAAFFKITAAAYGMYERDLREPPFSFLISFCRHFDITSDFLLGLNNFPNPFITVDINSHVKTPRDRISQLPDPVREDVEDYMEYRLARYHKNNKNKEA